MPQAMRYKVVNGVLRDKVVDTSKPEEEGWLPSPHRFRVLTVHEFLAEGKHPQEAALLHQREIRRVKHIYAGASLEEADRLADSEEPVPASGVEADAMRSDVAELQERLSQSEKAYADFRMAHDRMVTKFKAEHDALLAELAKLKAKGSAKFAAKAAETPAEG